MKVRYSVTFEFETRPALVHEGTVVASSGATCMARATREAQKVLHPVGWSSVVCCLLERLEETKAPTVDREVFDQAHGLRPSVPYQSAQPCGCDPAENWVCGVHHAEEVGKARQAGER